MTHPKIGFALGGGAARGWAHIGIIRALAEMGIRPDVIAGTSIGSLVGAAYAADCMEELEDWVSNLRRRDVAALLDINLFAGGIIEGEKLMKTFKSYFSNKDISELKIPYGAVATDLSSGGEVWLQDGDLWNAIRASIAVPGLFSPWYYRDKWLADGGLVNPVPISLCRSLGAEKIIAVNLNSNLITKHFDAIKFKKNNHHDKITANDDADFSTWLTTIKNRITGEEQNSRPGIIDVLGSSLYIMQERITRSRMAGDPADVLLNPHLEDIGMMEFNRADDAIEEGYQVVQRMREHILRNIDVT